VKIPVTVTDITGQEPLFTLDSHGFQLVHHVSREKTFLSEEGLRTSYFPEMEQFLKTVYVNPTLLLRQAQPLLSE
jgi:hypothetical protein